MKIIQLELNNIVIEFYNPEDIGLRLNRIIQKAENFSVKGSSFSTSLTIPKTKNNNKFFLSKDLLGSLNKFNAIALYKAQISVDGEVVITGTFKLEKISKDGFVGEINSQQSEWIDLMDKKQLNELGYVDGVPTWFTPFEGATTIQSDNNLPIGQSVYKYPTIVYNNTPLIDYFGYTANDLYGTYDGLGNQTAPPLDFPNIFPLRNGYFSWRDGLTFEDFPPAIHYKTLILKCFEEIGWNVSGEIFDLDWFKALILPYVGEGFKYNWKTLAYLYTELLTNTESAISYPFFADLENFFEVEQGAPPIPNLAQFITPNIATYEDVPTRIDRITNFKKFLVADSYVEEFKQSGYIVPIGGRYRIRVKSRLLKHLYPDGVGGATALDNYASAGSPNYGWDDNVLVITRRNEVGDFVLNDDYRNNLGLWMSSINTSFITQPSDVIAYVSPKRYNLLGVDIESIGSPLSNWVEQPTASSVSHSIIVNNNFEKSSESIAELLIEIDLLKNERINFNWFSFINIFNNNGTNVDNLDYFLGGGVNEEIEIEYLCGYEDIDIASNLPQKSIKEFISSFINQFNLQFNLLLDNTIEFVFSQNFTSPFVDCYDISDRVNMEEIEISPCSIPNNVSIGYENDENDYLLVKNVDGCEFNTNTQVLSYGNVVETSNPNIYSNNNLVVSNGFSSTKFVKGNLDLMRSFPLATITQVLFTNPIDPLEYTVAWWRFTDGSSLVFDIPSIQSFDSFNQRTLQDLEYSNSYSPRLLYFLGTASDYLGTDNRDRIKIDSYGSSYTSIGYLFALEPTICSFDTENNNPYPSLRYDGMNGLYNSYFDNIIELYNSSYLVECEIYLTSKDWRNLNGSKFVRLYDNKYKLLEIQNYDPLENSPCKIILIKV